MCPKNVGWSPFSSFKFHELATPLISLTYNNTLQKHHLFSWGNVLKFILSIVFEPGCVLEGQNFQNIIHTKVQFFPSMKCMVLSNPYCHPVLSKFQACFLDWGSPAYSVSPTTDFEMWTIPKMSIFTYLSITRPVFQTNNWVKESHDNFKIIAALNPDVRPISLLVLSHNLRWTFIIS